MPSDITTAETAELAPDVQAVLDIAVRAWCHDGMRERLREVCEQYPGEFRDLITRASEAVVTDPDAAVGRPAKCGRTASVPAEMPLGRELGTALSIPERPRLFAAA